MKIGEMFEEIAFYFVRAKLARSLDEDVMREMRQRRTVTELEIQERVLPKAA